jgi:hypothetical protein
MADEGLSLSQSDSKIDLGKIGFERVKAGIFLRDHY